VSHYADLLGECLHVWHFQIWLHLGWGRGAKTWLRVASVDPDRDKPSVLAGAISW